MRQEKTRTWLRAIVALVGTVFLGAVGSGLWDLFLRNLFLTTFTRIASGIGKLSSSYLDGLHDHIGQAQQTELMALPFGLLITFVGLTKCLRLPIIPSCPPFSQGRHGE